MLKKPVYDHLAAKVNNIDTNDVVLKTKYQTGKNRTRKEIPDTKTPDLQTTIPNLLKQKTKLQTLVVQQRKLY